MATSDLLENLPVPEENKFNLGKNLTEADHNLFAGLRYFDDLTGTVLAGHHQPLQVWVLCLYFMGLNLSNTQISKELGLHPTDAQRMTEQLREGLVARVTEPVLSGTVECDEVYIVAGHKGNPAAVRKKNAKEDVDG